MSCTPTARPAKLSKAALRRLDRCRAYTYEGSMYEGATLRSGTYVTLRVDDFDKLRALASSQILT